MIRNDIVRLIMANGRPPTIDELAMELQQTSDEVRRRLAVEPLLDSAGGLDSARAAAAEAFYRPLGLFTPAEVQLIEQLTQTRKRLEDIERKRKEP